MAYNPRLFLDKTFLPTTVLPVDITLTEQAHYLHAVLRLKPNDRVDLIIDQTHFIAHWVSGSAKQGIVQITHCAPLAPNTLPNITLAVSLIPEERWRWLLQKATELGVSHVVPLQTEYSKVKSKAEAGKLTRWQAIMEAAACQSEGLFIPTISAPVTINQLLATSLKQHNILLYERAADRQPLAHCIQPVTKDDSVLVIIGPEGGWSPKEKSIFQQHHCQLAALGQRVLRTETAAIAALSTIAAFSNPDG